MSLSDHGLPSQSEAETKLDNLRQNLLKKKNSEEEVLLLEFQQAYWRLASQCAQNQDSDQQSLNRFYENIVIYYLFSNRLYDLLGFAQEVIQNTTSPNKVSDTPLFYDLEILSSHYKSEKRNQLFSKIINIHFMSKDSSNFVKDLKVAALLLGLNDITLISDLQIQGMIWGCRIEVAKLNDTQITSYFGDAIACLKSFASKM